MKHCFLKAGTRPTRTWVNEEKFFFFVVAVTVAVTVALLTLWVGFILWNLRNLGRDVRLCVWVWV